MTGEDASNTDGVPVFHDAGTVTITNDQTNLQVSGYLNAAPAYEFSAKVFDRGSVFGISGGPISKLAVRHEGAIVAQYDRGWVEHPRTTTDRRAVQAIIRAFPDRSETKNMEAEPKITRLSQERSIGRNGVKTSRNRQDGGRER